MKRNIIITIVSVLILTCLIAFARTITTDLGLVKPTWTEGTDILDDINANSDILEAFANDPLEFDTGERLEDRVGAMFTGNTETFLILTYQDDDNTIDAVVPVKDEDAMTSDSATFLCTQQSIKAYADTLHALQYLKTEIDSLAKVETIYGKNILDTTELDTFSKLQALVADKTLVNEEDVFTIDANWVNTANPWADNEVSDTLTSSSCTGTAAVATAVTITDNEDTAENNPIVFVAGGDLDGGDLGLESDGTLYYTPSTGVVTATGFAGALTGAVTGTASGNLTEVKDDTTPELGGDQDCNNLDLTEVKTVQFNGVYAIGNSGSTETVDWQNGAYQSITIDEACVISFSNEYVGTLNLLVTYGGSFALTFTGMTLLEEGGTEIVTTDAAGTDLLIFKNLGTADTYVMGAMLDIKD